MEEKKFNELLTKVMAELTDEQKAKAAECKDEGELCELLGKMGVALPDELIDCVAGGFVWKNPGLGTGTLGLNNDQGTEGSDPFNVQQSKRIF